MVGDDEMKKLIIGLFFIVFFSACEVKEIDYTALIDDLYADAPIVGSQEDDEPGTISEWTFDYEIIYENFAEMMNCEYSEFVYGKVVEKRERNTFSRYLYIEIYQTGFNEQRQIIRLAEMHEDVFASVGGTYVFNLIYQEDYDEYAYSQQSESVFWVHSGEINIPDLFYDDLKDKKDIDLFLDYIFPEEQ